MAYNIEDYLDRYDGGRGVLTKQANVKFEYIWEYNEPESLKEGRPIFKQVEMVSVQYPGGDETVIHVNDTHRKDYRAQYNDFLEREGKPTNGTPLHEWALINTGTVNELKHFKIKTIEQLVNFEIAPDNKHGFFLKTWQDKAIVFLDSAKDAKSKLVSMTNLNKKLEAKVKKLEQETFLLRSRIEANEGISLNGITGSNN